MGQAKQRGSYQERKRQAIEAGRVKRPTPIRPIEPMPGLYDGNLGIATLLALMARSRSRKPMVERKQTDEQGE